MERISAKGAPKALGPYCHGTKQGNLIFTSGQVPLDPVTNELETDIRKATHLVLNNLISIVEEGGGCLETVAKVDILVKDLADYTAINEEYANFFGDSKPARVISQISDLPANASLEMVMTAFVKE